MVKRTMPTHLCSMSIQVSMYGTFRVRNGRVQKTKWILKSSGCVYATNTLQYKLQIVKMLKMRTYGIQTWRNGENKMAVTEKMTVAERLREVAKKSAGHIDLIEGREKAMQEELVGREVTLKDFDFLESDGNTFAVFVVEEEPKKYYNGGTSITRLCQDISCDEELVAEVRENGLRLKLTATKTKSKRDFVAIEIL